MIGRRIQWYCLAENRSELSALFEFRKIVIHKAIFGTVLLIYENDEFFAFRNKCPHQGKPLDDCRLSDGYLVCPFHHYHFSLNDGRGHGLYLEKYPIEMRNDGSVWVGVERWSLF